jgi:hypothetical protein
MLKDDLLLNSRIIAPTAMQKEMRGTKVLTLGIVGV